MMDKAPPMKTKSAFILFLVMLLLCVFLTSCSMSPTLIIVISNAPPDITISLPGKEPNDSDKHGIWKIYYILQPDNNGEDLVLNVSSSKGSFEKIIKKEQISLYINHFDIISWDFANDTITPGRTLSAHIPSICFNAVLVTLLQGALLYLFGYRLRKSYLIFLPFVLVVHITINVYQFNSAPFVFTQIGARIFAEMFFSPIKLLFSIFLVREHKTSKGAAFTFTANVLSFLFDIVLIHFLPV